MQIIVKTIQNTNRKIFEINDITFKCNIALATTLYPDIDKSKYILDITDGVITHTINIERANTATDEIEYTESITFQDKSGDEEQVKAIKVISVEVIDDEGKSWQDSNCESIECISTAEYMEDLDEEFEEYIPTKEDIRRLVEHLTAQCDKKPNIIIMSEDGITDIYRSEEEPNSKKLS